MSRYKGHMLLFSANCDDLRHHVRASASVINDHKPHAVPTAIDQSRQLTYDGKQTRETKAIGHREK